MSIAIAADDTLAAPAAFDADREPAAGPSTIRPSMQQIVRNALHADALTSPSAERAVLERELDRLQPLVAAEQTVLSQQLNWTMLSQALLLNVFIVALVFGSAPTLPGKRWLLAGIAIFATVVAVLAYFAYRGSRQSLRGLLQRRTELEASLQSLGRQPAFTPDRTTRGTSALAARLLPAAFVAGWLAVSVYALASPGSRPMDARVSVTAPAAAASAPAAAGAAAAARPRNARPATAVGSAASGVGSTGSAVERGSQGEADSEQTAPRSGVLKW